MLWHVYIHKNRNWKNLFRANVSQNRKYLTITTYIVVLELEKNVFFGETIFVPLYKGSALIHNINGQY